MAHLNDMYRTKYKIKYEHRNRKEKKTEKNGKAAAARTHDSMGQCTLKYNLRMLFFFRSIIIFHLLPKKKCWFHCVRIFCCCCCCSPQLLVILHTSAYPNVEHSSKSKQPKFELFETVYLMLCGFYQIELTLEFAIYQRQREKMLSHAIKTIKNNRTITRYASETSNELAKYQAIGIKETLKSFSRKISDHTTTNASIVQSTLYNT